MNESSIFMIADNNFYVTEEEYTAILSNPKTLPLIRHRYPAKLRPIDISYALGKSDLRVGHLVNKKDYYYQITSKGILYYDSRGNRLDQSRLEYNIILYGMECIDLKIDDPDYSYTMNFIIKLGDYGPTID